MNSTTKLSLLVLSAFGLANLGSAQTLNVDVGITRSSGDYSDKTDAAARLLNRNLGILTRQSRARLAAAGAYDTRIPLSFPSTIWLTSQGTRLPGSYRASSRAPGITLEIESTGPNAFSPADRTYLQSVFNRAQPFIDASFGAPAVDGVVKVKNYDATMGDRDVVAGGYYVPNAPGGPEIRFPVYPDKPEVTAINFIHCLLLAYLGPNQYGYDAFKEGLVRGVTLKLARTPSALPAGLDQELIERVLTNSYDVEGLYDWFNQRALGGAQFIAPNLVNGQIPDAGSVGGLYLLRYRMAGSAWAKVMSEHPGFATTFNSAYYANPSIASNVPALVALAQTTLNTLRPGDPTVEGLSFANWFKRQYILETKTTRGPKLLVQTVPITSSLSGNEFGVFLVQAHYFETKSNGDELLLSGTSYPILWEGSLIFNRLFSNAQDERMDLAGGYGSVAPNLSDNFGGQPYRAAIEVPIGDQIQRVYVPAGAIATASQPTEKDFYGTVVGANLQTGDVLRLQVTVNGAAIADVPVANNAFGVRLATSSFLSSAQLVVRVVRKRGAVDTTLLTRKVSKTPGSLALDLRIESEVDYTYPTALPKGIAFVGFPVDPFASLNSDVLGIADNQVLAARYNSSKAKYDLYPDMEPFQVGHGYFIRSNAATPFVVSGRIYKNVAASVALKPGWNMISGPLVEAIATNRVQVVKSTGFPTAYAQSAGVDIGTEFFQFTPGPADTASGAPETGTLTPATTFEPGKAYFVRVLAPEGVTLSFSPASYTGSSVTRSLAAPKIDAGGWQMNIEMTQDRNRRATAIIGQSATATRSFDPREDSGMPPGLGGFQVILEDYEAMYRDIRLLGQQETYTVHLQGLVKGKMHKLNFTVLKGKVSNFTLRDSKGKSLGSFRPGFSYSFVPKSNDEWIQIVIGGKK